MTTINRRSLLLGAGATAAFGALTHPTVAQAAPRPRVLPLRRAHAHNDYEHDRPLLDALHHGFTSVEADVWLEKDELFIGHDGPDRTRTLRSLYLDPLRHRRRGHNHLPTRLLIDVKSHGEQAYEVLNRQLSRYPDLFTSWRNGRRHQRPVTAVLSGELANITVPDSAKRWFGFDGRIGALPAGATAEQLPLVSENWNKFFSWRGIGPMPSSQRERLHALVAGLHAENHQVRFWETPDLLPAPRRAVWRELLAADVDVLNTDHLADLQDFLLAEDR